MITASPSRGCAVARFDGVQRSPIAFLYAAISRLNDGEASFNPAPHTSAVGQLESYDEHSEVCVSVAAWQPGGAGVAPNAPPDRAPPSALPAQPIIEDSTEEMVSRSSVVFVTTCRRETPKGLINVVIAAARATA